MNPTTARTTVGLYVNTGKPEAVAYGTSVAAMLRRRGLRLCADAATASALGLSALEADACRLAQADIIVTLGGDGTILAAAALAAPLGIPILGVHMGQFGFIAEAHPDSLEQHLEAFLDGRAHIEERMMLNCEVVREGVRVAAAESLNDVVLTKGSMTRMLRMSTAFGDHPPMEFPADGVVVATPTGSTAYALSAGGPLVEPTVHALVVVPICAHTLAARPLVTPADMDVGITVLQASGEVVLSADSLEVCRLTAGDRVLVRRSAFTTRIVSCGGPSFYGKVRRRLLWGERLNG
jgi:NAD+ kinase